MEYRKRQSLRNQYSNNLDNQFYQNDESLRISQHGHQNKFKKTKSQSPVKYKTQNYKKSNSPIRQNAYGQPNFAQSAQRQQDPKELYSISSSQRQNVPVTFINKSLPKTGIDQPFLANRPYHNQKCPKTEPLAKDLSLENKNILIENLRDHLCTLIREEVLVYDSYDSPKDRKGHYIDEAKRVASYSSKESMEYDSAANGVELNRFYSELPQFYQLEDEQDETLIFESRFEGGNLMKAIKIDQFEYNLYVNVDTATDRHTHWFYFRVSNTRAKKTYRFNIMNLDKKESQFQEGMKPLFYSVKQSANKNGIGWYRDGHDIVYFQNHLAKVYNSKQYYSTLSFEVEFPFTNDDVYIAPSYPYTYSDVMNFIFEACEKNKDSTILRRQTLCQSTSGNNCELLIITDFSSPEDKIQKREGIILSARVHAAETSSSFVMEGVLNFLLSNDKQAKYLRSSYVFKIVPMVNIDGVIVGNTRTSINGFDMNRQWRALNGNLCPQISALKSHIEHTQTNRKIAMYVDFHMHSRQKNSFFYGCHNDYDEENIMKERIFPLIFSNQAQNFNFDYCKFDVQPDKDNTGRVTIQKQFNIINSFTFETSICGPNTGNQKNQHFSIAMLQELGMQFGKALYIYTCDVKQVNKTIEQLQAMYPTIDHLLDIDDPEY